MTIKQKIAKELQREWKTWEDGTMTIEYGTTTVTISKSSEYLNVNNMLVGFNVELCKVVNVIVSQGKLYIYFDWNCGNVHFTL